jgi:hypothetical protein
MEGFEMSDDERAALDELVPPDRQTGDIVRDIRAGMAETMRRRDHNTDVGGRIFAAAYRLFGSWDKVSEESGIPKPTVYRWGIPFRRPKRGRSSGGGRS